MVATGQKTSLKKVGVFEILTFFNEVFAIQDVSMTIQDSDEKTLTNSAILKLSRLQQDKN